MVDVPPLPKILKSMLIIFPPSTPTDKPPPLKVKILNTEFIQSCMVCVYVVDNY